MKSPSKLASSSSSPKIPVTDEPTSLIACSRASYTARSSLMPSRSSFIIRRTESNTTIPSNMNAAEATAASTGADFNLDTNTMFAIESGSETPSATTHTNASDSAPTATTAYPSAEASILPARILFFDFFLISAILS